MIESAEGWRSEHAPEMPLIVGLGSSNREESMQNPWSSEERYAMLESWFSEAGISAEIAPIPDIDDPPNWVSHAEKYHGGAGFFFTSDIQTAQLYESSGWEVVLGELEHREGFEGWRVRATARMMSTVDDRQAVMEVLSTTVPEVIVSHLLDNGLLRRLAFLGEGGEPVG
jgi:nicotinamide mononucleotide adenylyltransferase